MARATTPIDALIPAILAHLRAGPNLVIEAPPGAGKTTRVPPALLDLDPGQVWVLEPRRLAARLAARFVASERGEPLGETVGYQVRFEEVAGTRTRLRFVTEGVLTRRLLADPRLRGVATVVLDEFHERHLDGDVALALLRRLQRTTRRDLRIVAMSATLDAAPVAAYLGGCPVVRSEGRQYPLEIAYTPHSPAPLEEQVAAAVRRLGEPQGHVLVFLPGAAEIRRAASAIRHDGYAVLPLHGDQSPEEQDRAVAPSARPKLILATNVAESSVTIDGVTAVIDSGLARIASYSPWTGLPSLTVGRISQASANQRAGRAGRTGPGRALRLYPLDDFVRRPAQQTAEILRADLAGLALQIHAMGMQPDDLEWLEAPPRENVAHAEDVLARLGAIAGDGRLTEIGEEMARLPLHPRLARLVIEAQHRGAGADGAAVAGLLSAGERLPAAPHAVTPSDLLVLLESRWTPAAERTVRQIQRIARAPRGARRDEQALLLAVLAAFPDRVARRRPNGELQLCDGSPAALARESTVRDAALLVAVEVEDRREQRLPLVRLASAVEPEWLLELFPERVRELRETRWNKQTQQAEARTALLFDELVLEERSAPASPEQAAELLAARAWDAGVEQFADAEELAAYRARRAFAGRPVGDEECRAALAGLAVGLRGFDELKQACRDGALVRELHRRLASADSRRVDELAPERIRLPGGRQVRVNYESGKPPWIESRLQDFFGMKESPRVGGAPVVIHLLAPNHRPVQTTTDLAGFWSRLYPQVRKELMRRYPKHAWPEDPLTASPR